MKNELAPAIPWDTELKIDPKSVPIDVERACAFVMANAPGATEFQKASAAAVKQLADFRAEVEKLLPGIMVDVRTDAKRAYAEQQAKIGKGEKLENCWGIEDFTEDIRGRIRATKAALQRIGGQTLPLAQEVCAKFDPLIEQVCAKLEADERAAHDLAGVSAYMPSLLLVGLRRLPGQLRGHCPNLPTAMTAPKKA